MIDEKKLAELRRINQGNDYRYGSDPREAWDTIEALWKVARAAEELCKRAYLMSGYVRLPGDPPAIIQLKDLELALAALRESEKTHGV